MSIKMILSHLFLLLSLTNANYLYFERHSTELLLSESTEIYTKLTTIKAIFSPFLSIEYELHSDTNRTFYLNSQTGELILINHLDYETIPRYKLTIEARSLHPLLAPCFTELIIQILNINDHAPEIHLILYPSVLYESNIIKYDSNSSSTPFATINIKDLDESTKNLTLILNDTQHFQIQLIRQNQNNFIYLLSTRNNSYLNDQQDDYYLSLTSCDDDQPLLCTNQSYQFQLKSKEYLCQLSFNQKTYLIDIREDLPMKSLLMHKISNKFCEEIFYSIDDTENFYIDSKTGDLFTLKKFHRIERSIYMIQLFLNQQLKMKILVRILDQYGNIPFLMKKYLMINRKKLSSVHLFNSTLCRSQEIMENYFQLLSNCTILPLIQPPKGQYLFYIELIQGIIYQDTFLLEVNEEERRMNWTQLSWRILLVGILIMLGIIIGTIIILQQKRCRVQIKQSTLPSSINVENHYHKSDVYSTVSKLKVHDDQDVSSTPTRTAIYLIGKLSPALSSLSPIRDDEGYSGSSDVSENHLPVERTIISANQLLERYRRQPLYDVPRRYPTPCHFPDVSLV